MKFEDRTVSVEGTVVKRVEKSPLSSVFRNLYLVECRDKKFSCQMLDVFSQERHERVMSENQGKTVKVVLTPLREYPEYTLALLHSVEIVDGKKDL